MLRAAAAGPPMSRTAALLVLVAGCFAGCTRAPDPGPALAESARATIDAVEAAADAPSASPAAVEDVPLPADFPADLVLPEAYAVVSVMTMGPSRSVVLRSDEPMPALYERFRAAQAARGWRETVSMLGPEGAMVGLSKGRRGVVANFRPDAGGRTLVSLSLQPQTL